MNRTLLSPFRPTGRRWPVFVTIAALGLTGGILATPPSGFLVNQITAMGSTTDSIGQQVQIASDPNADDDSWQAQLQVQGGTDFYVQQLVLAPGGYSGWHTHPGILVGTVVSGSIDFFDETCHKHTIAAGQMFEENNRVHAINNPGSTNAELSIVYLMKHNAVRRIEADAPACAPSTMIP
jgi:quercetin dioxygenase-like cupin family protein